MRDFRKTKQKLFTHITENDRGHTIVEKHVIPLVDVWKESTEDKIFKTGKGVLVLPVSKFYNIDNPVDRKSVV